LVPAEIFAAYGSLYMKKGAIDFSFNLRKLRKSMTAIFGIFLFGLSMILYLFALSYSDLSVIYPLSTITYVLIAFLSVKHLGEKITKTKWLGIIFIIIGCFFVVR
ncbi:MAG: EamA family transporter, partial [Nanoarchaeota archaeon]